ncbi:ABC transporter permease [Rubrimonas sp.]|uniref:ABC transporter permease n=1 Tax=Rubrimonas sp. TaxID=2036015 RepID=UPI002FDD8EBD
MADAALPSAPRPAPARAAPLTVDGQPLKRRLAQAQRRVRLRAFALVAPLLLFILLVFVAPIAALMAQGVHNPTFALLMPNLTPMLRDWDARSEPTEAMFAALHADLLRTREDRTIGQVATRVNRELSGTRSLFTSTARRVDRMEPPYRDALIAEDAKWGEMATWEAMKVASKSLTGAFYAAALDRTVTAQGEVVQAPPEQRIHVSLFLRTLEISLAVTILCLILGYPVAWLLANLPLRTANLLLILVLLPFWTSLLVRTTAWIALLQSQGVINDLMVWSGVTSDANRFSMIYNKTGTLVAMTHILLPFMILPLYSVMKTIPPTYLRAAKSLGASNWTAFWRVYFPQTVPGIGAGALLVFILAIGYYITPALVGGQSGTMISNFIAFHMERSLNWSLAAALGGILLAGVLILYAVYQRLIGIDNVKLG